MSQEEELLDNLLSAATEELEILNKSKNTLKETDIFQNESNFHEKTPKDGPSTSIHNADSDTSDDEDNRNCENRKYSEYGKEIKHLLKHSSLPLSSNSGQIKNKSLSWNGKTTFTPSRSGINSTEISKLNVDVYTDPVFGMRIINPLISSTVLKERMMGREAVPFSRVSRFLQLYNKDKDWVIAGVIINKSAVKTSQKGSQFCIWTLSDLKDDIKTVSLFLFSSAYKQLWKTVVGTVVGILNPNILDKRDGSKDEASLSIDNSQKVMIFGKSKDFGTCKSTKKNGEQCTAVVNLNRCEFCLYHIKQEYQKCSKRSELQANFAGRGLIALRNKVLGKNEVFYAGKSYMAIPAKRNRKMEQRDNSRLESLNRMGISTNSNNIVKSKNKNTVGRKQNASRLEVSLTQRLRDMELLKKLGGHTDIDSKNHFTATHSSEVTLEESKSNAINTINKLKKKSNSSVSSKEDSINEMLSKVDDKRNIQEKPEYVLGETQSMVTDISIKAISKTQKNEDILLNRNLNDGNLDDNINLNFNSKPTQEVLEHDVLWSENDQCLSTALCEKNILTSMTNTNKLSNTELNKSGSSTICKNSAQIILTNSKKMSPDKDHINSLTVTFPTLSGSGSNNLIDLNKPITFRHIDRAKLNAIKLIQKTGPLKKIDPNSTKGSGKKRPIEERNISENTAKKSKLAESEFISDRFKKMMAVTSKHLDLLESRDDEEQEKYFNKLEKKEQMEEKMINTFKVSCKAVKCLKCKYTNFSASEICKNERHPLKVFDAIKRFFKCGNCGNRTVSLNIIPTGLCLNCGSGKWERTGMMKEKVEGAVQTLSIRGGEQKFINSVVADANLNLLVPDN